MKKINRKQFLKAGALAAAGISLGKVATSNTTTNFLNNKQVGFNHLPNKEEKTMKTVLHKANTRGRANHGWLNSHHTFSFANYYNPERMHFGVLRVLNDDVVEGGMGFGKHPHDNMEIISIPLEGDLEHQDNMGTKAVIRKNDVQAMSAGTGVYHSEYNKSKEEKVRFLKIWVFPNKNDVNPRYDQVTFDPMKRINQWQQILSPNPKDEGVWIHQDAWFNRAKIEVGQSLSYNFKKEGNGVYVFVLDGTVEVNGELLQKRDGLGITETNDLTFTSKQDTEVLVMDVPMQIS